MSRTDELPWGAKIERGEVIAVHTSGETDFRYDVKSIDRPGVTAYGMAAARGSYGEGAYVYFFLFEDGNGLILDAML